MSVTSLTAARATKTLIERVYVAGPVLSGDSEGSLAVLPWRCEIFGVCPDSEFWELTANTHTGCFYYAGPTISACHGASDPKLAQNCLRELALADPLFAWIDRIDTVGLLVEIGAAFTQRKPIFLAFSDRNIADRLYFIEQLADISVVARSAPAAWKLFTHWRAVE
ncbi:MAG TPA: hypothetical protein VKF35_16620 [Hyphomicrobiaceae bacterium]|nr:hypothetical protein [Hyphomicrobiaceae bacterium]